MVLSFFHPSPPCFPGAPPPPPCAPALLALITAVNLFVLFAVGDIMGDPTFLEDSNALSSEVVVVTCPPGPTAALPVPLK